MTDFPKVDSKWFPYLGGREAGLKPGEKPWHHEAVYAASAKWQSTWPSHLGVRPWGTRDVRKTDI